MRYLRVTAQDRTGNGRADSLLLRFYEEVAGRPDKLLFKAAALDMTGDGKVDFQFGDINRDGWENHKDEQLLKVFADAFLKLNWFNRGKNWQRYAKLQVQAFREDGRPELVRLDFHQGNGVPRNQTLVYQAQAVDSSGNGTLNVFSNDVDMNRDGVIDKKDQDLTRLLANTFLKFKWYCRPSALEA